MRCAVVDRGAVRLPKTVAAHPIAPGVREVGESTDRLDRAFVLRAESCLGVGSRSRSQTKNRMASALNEKAPAEIARARSCTSQNQGKSNRKSYESQLIQRRVPCFDPIGQSMLHPDASGMKHGTRETHENYLGFVSAMKPLSASMALINISGGKSSSRAMSFGRKVASAQRSRKPPHSFGSMNAIFYFGRGEQERASGRADASPSTLPSPSPSSQKGEGTRITTIHPCQSSLL